MPASITVVTPFSRLSTNVSVAATPSSSGVWASLSGTAQEKIDSPGGRSSGTQLRASGSPVVCWWVLTKPGVTTQPVASSSGVPGYAARTSAVVPTATMRPAADGDGAVEDDPALGVDRQQVAAGDEQVGLGQPSTCSTENSMLLPSGSVTMQM